MLTAVALNAQSINISGKVTDRSGAPIPGVTVYVSTSNNGTSTDMDGKYSILVNKGETLSFVCIGYNSQNVVIGDKSLIDITLEEELLELDETIVVGYGLQSKRTVTSAITKVSGSEISNIPINSVSDGLKGKVAGARVYSANNTPGAEPTIIIRGGSSISGNDSPLILVDGIERDLSGINPNDIESMEILKDAASSAIYGSRASNGVVLVTTKKGSANSAPRITFEAGVAIEQPERMISYMGSEEAINLMRPRLIQGPHPEYAVANYNAYSSGNTLDSKYSLRILNPGESIPDGYFAMDDPINPGTTLIYQDNSWTKECFQNALWQNYYMGIDGGSDKVKYLASVGYTDDSGVAVGTNFSRFSARTNLDVKINKKLSFRGGFDFNQTHTNAYASQYQVITRGLMTPTTQKIYHDHGPYIGTPTSGRNGSSPTPTYYSYYNDNDQKHNKIGINGALDYDIIDGLRATLQTSLFSSALTGDNFTRANENNGSRPSSSTLTDEQRKKIEAFLTYTKTFRIKHNFSAMGGYSYQDFYSKYLRAAAQDALSDKIPTLNAGPTKTDATTTKIKEVMIGYFGRINYDYNRKYMLTLTFRADGSSRFVQGKQWGFFPGASAGWVMSEEDFMKDAKAISNLKWRVSYGQTGNNYVGYYDALGLYAITTKYNGEASIVPSSMPNQGLTWETSTQLDAGFDLGMFDNRVQMKFDYFDKITDNLITSKVLPNTSGYSSILTNLGKVKFYGFDIELESRNIDNRDFTWNSKFVWSFVKNRVLKLPETGKEGDQNRVGGITVTMADGSVVSFGGMAEGEPLGRFYGFETDYIITTQEQADKARYDTQSRGWDWTKKGYVNGSSSNSVGLKAIGDYEWKDFNGDNIIDGSDVFLQGNIYPVSTGGFGNYFTWKNFGLNIYLDWALGHSIANNYLQRQMCNFFGNNTSLPTEIRKCWDPEAGMDVKDAKYARFGGNDSDDLNKNFRPASNTFTQKGDYLCIREVSLQYTLSGKGVKKAGLQNIVFTLSGNNLHYFTEVIGMSPETGTDNAYSGSFFTYPPIRRVSFGAKFTF